MCSITVLLHCYVRNFSGVVINDLLLTWADLKEYGVPLILIWPYMFLGIQIIRYCYHLVGISSVSSGIPY